MNKGPGPLFTAVHREQGARPPVHRPEGAPKGSVSVNAEHGVVFLRGEVPGVEQIKELESAAREVDGVKEVNNLLHPPKTDAPTEAEGKIRSVAKR